MEPDTTLLPCPFCGSEAILVELDNNRYKVRCSDYMDCCIEQGYSFNLEDAVEAWNRRK